MIKKIVKLLTEKEIFIFDFDGVIVNSNHIKAENFFKIFEINSIILKNKIIEYHNKNIGKSRFDKIRYFLKNFEELKKYNFESNALLKKFSDNCIESISKCEEISGSTNFLKVLKKKRKEIILLSATPTSELKSILLNRNLDKMFKTVAGFPVNKTKFISSFISKRSYDKKKIVFFGDSNSDYLAAKKNNIDFIHVKSNLNFTYKSKKIYSIDDFNF